MFGKKRFQNLKTPEQGDVFAMKLHYEKKIEELTRLCEERNKEKGQLEEKFLRKEALVKEYQKTILEQRALIEKGKRYCAKLEKKIEDLNYEIRTLLKWEPFEESLPLPIPEFEKGEPLFETSSTYDLSLTLLRYVEEAEGFQGSILLDSGSKRRFLDSSLTIDFRHLIDIVQKEKGHIVFIYSRLQKKMVFATHFVKQMLKIPPERFVKEFPSLLIHEQDWEVLLKKAATNNEGSAPLVLRDKNNHKIPFHALVRRIAKGPFAEYFIGILKGETRFP